MKVSMSLYESHLQLIDEVVASGTHGNTQGEVMVQALLDHGRHILAGGDPFDPAPWTYVKAPMPEVRLQRLEARLEPGEGKAVPVLQGEVIELSQLVGGQCIDFNGYNLHDYKEWLDCGFNRQRGIVTGAGTVIWSGSPRARPMYLILDAAETCDQYYSGHRCNGHILEREYGFQHHASCQDAFAESIREYGLTEDDVHDSYNFWMHTYVDDAGRRIYAWNRARRGDSVRLLALFDTLSVPVCCPSELNAVNNFDPQPVSMAVHEATSETHDLVSKIQEEWHLEGRKTPDDFKIKDIRAERALVADDSFQPNFISMPERSSTEVELSDAEATMLQGLIARGNYGSNEGQALLVAFLRWYDMEYMRRRYMKVVLTE